MLGNGINQTTTTTGTGDLTLTAVSGAPTFTDVFDVNQLFSYSLLTAEGLFIESGLAYLSSATVMVRAKVNATYSGGTYTKVSAAAVSLSGTTTIICTPTSSTLSSVLPTVDDQSAGINRFVTAANRTIGNTPASVVALRCYYVPFLLATGGTIVSMSVNVTGAVAGDARCGVYSCNEKGYVGSLLAETANLNIGSTGIKTDTLAAPVRLSPGWYFVACVASSNASIISYQSSTSNLNGGSPLGFSGTTPIEFRYEVLGSAVLPATANAATTGVNLGINHIPLVYLGMS